MFESELATLAGQLNLLNARLVQVAAQLVATHEWRDGGQRSPAGYLAWRMGLSPERAQQVVRVAHKRADYPALIAEFDAGQLSIDQIDAALRAPAWADTKVVDFVKIATVGKIRRAMRPNQFEHDPDQPVSEPVRQDRLSFGVGRDGRWRIRGELGIDDGRLIEAALTERKDALFTAGDEHVTWPEAFVDCFARSLGAVESVTRRDHYRTWLHLDVDGEAMTTDGWRIPLAIRDHLLCDGVIQPVWARDGIPFSVGHTQRIVPERTRRIVEYRDRGCRVPGCSSHYVEIHHIIHWLDGGPTDTWNLISLRLSHELGASAAA
jgi:hypothetical protein